MLLLLLLLLLLEPQLHTLSGVRVIDTTNHEGHGGYISASDSGFGMWAGIPYRILDEDENEEDGGGDDDDGDDADDDGAPPLPLQSQLLGSELLLDRSPCSPLAVC